MVAKYKMIAFIVILIMFSYFATPQRSLGNSYEVRTFYGTGGKTSVNLSDINMSYGMTQHIIGNNTVTDYTTNIGLFYIPNIDNVTIFIPPAPLALFNFFLYEIGIEYAKVNWTI